MMVSHSEVRSASTAGCLAEEVPGLKGDCGISGRAASLGCGNRNQRIPSIKRVQTLAAAAGGDARADRAAEGGEEPSVVGGEVEIGVALRSREQGLRVIECIPWRTRARVRCYSKRLLGIAQN